MMYALILITVLSFTDDAIAENKGVFSDMTECFDARDDILVEKEQYSGHFENNTQAVCIFVKQ